MFGIIVLYILGAVCAVFLILGVIALITKPQSVYSKQPDQKNPLEGKSVVFVADEAEGQNADGASGHLEETEPTPYAETFYGRFVKRVLDVILSFGGLVLLSPVFLILTIAILIDDPGPVLFTQKRVGKNKQYFKLHKF